MAHDRRLLDVLRIHERDHVTSKLFHRVTTHGTIRFTMSALVQRVNTILLVHERQYLTERKPRVRVTVQQDYRNAVLIALVGITQTNTGLEQHTVKLHRRGGVARG